MKKLLLLMTAAVAALSLTAAPVDQATAFQKAKSFLANNLYAGKIMAPAAVQPVLLKAEMGSAKLNQPVYYIYNTSTTFLVVAGDDRAEEILMIGDRPLKDINNLAPGMIDMLNMYKEQIVFLQEHPNLEVKPIVSPKNTPSLRATTVGPLLSCNWDQQDPYYNQCKFTYNNRSYQCLTGCPATSASMVMYFWKYPTTATGTVAGYNGYLDLSSGWSSNQVSFTYSALSSTTFDWDNMLDDYTGSYTSAQGNAVATLMRYVGQAEQMIYGPNGSGISVDDAQHVADMFIRYGYDSSTTRLVKQYQNMDDYGNVSGQIYTEAQWAAMLQEEMLAGRPVVFMAVDLSNGGHAFNVDGYNSSTNKYHINFGWSGDGNNWCALNSFGYSSGWSSYKFDTYQQMIIGIQPPGQTTLPELTVNPTSLTFTGCQTGQTYTKTFTVTGTDLRGNVTVSSNSGTFAVSPTTITAEQAQAGATVTVTYKPTSSGTQNATITVSSTAAEDKTVSVSGTATTLPAINVDPATLNMSTTVGSSVSQTFNVRGTNLTGMVYLTCEGAEFTIDKSNITQSAAGIGTTVTVTYSPTSLGTHTGTVTLTSSGAQSATVQLNGQASLLTYAPVMLSANETYINVDKFRADWTDQTPDENVESYTLEVTPKPVVPEVELIASVDGTVYTNQSYQAVTLTAPWSGNNVFGGYGAMYFRNASHQSATTDGYIKYTIPAGYQNKTFTMKITTANTNYGSGRFVVGSTQTATVTYNMSKGETHSWLVTGSTGDVITITSPENQYSPDIAKIEVYSGDATAQTAMLMVQEIGDENSRLITGIENKYYTVCNLAEEGTFLYRVKAIYIDGTESDWSNVEEVTLFENGHGFVVGDVNHDNYVNITDVIALINQITGQNPGICQICADVNGDNEVNISDVIQLINRVSNSAQMLR
jgi:hypothetical protein